MTALAAVLTSVLPDALARSPVDEERARRLRANLRALRAVAHRVDSATAADLPDADPTLDIVGAELGRAAADLENSAADRLPSAALALVSTCIACHTRSAGPAVGANLPLVDPALVTYGRFPAAAIAGYLDRLGSWFKVHAPDPGRGTGLQAARAALALVDGLEWWGRDQAGGRLTRAELRFTAAAR